MTDKWTVHDPERGNARTLASRSEAEDIVEQMDEMGIDVDLYPPGEAPPEAVDAATDGGEAAEDAAPTPAEGGRSVDARAEDLPPRSVGEDPLTWVPGEFIDEIDGTPAINRKGFEVLSHFYGVDVFVDLDVPPEEMDFQYCRVKARAVTAEGRECEAFGSAHVDRDDDPELLLEMADTRARKRALSIATGVGAVAVEELRSEAGAQEGADGVE